MSAEETPPVHRVLALSAAAIILALDQAIKLGVKHLLGAGTQFSRDMSLGPFFTLTLAENHGVSMGFFTADTDSGRWMLVGLTAIIAGFVFWWLWRERAREDALGLGLILGGALGNIMDRVRLGHVTDYADFHIGEWRPFLIFNFADAAITIGVLILLARAILMREKAPAKESS